MKRAAFSALIALALLLPGAGWAHDEGDHEHDHDRARAAAESGAILPLATVLERLAASQPGQVLEVELERDGGIWIYEVKLLQAGGVVRKLKLDARTAQPLAPREGRRR